MPWPERSTMSLRTEFVELALMEGSNIRALSRRFGISPKTGYKWLARYRCEGSAGLMDRSRRPRLSPRITNVQVERALLDIRDANPGWGARKIRHVLAQQQSGPLPVPSTVTAILRRNGRLDPEESTKHTAFTRFEHEHPNDLWQMDFKGDFALANGQRCHPLTMLDDHARYCLLLAACRNEQTQTVQALLIGCFRTYGLPEKMLMDNGPPWGGGGVMRHTALSVWLMRLGVLVYHGRPWHPQTQGKEERFHRTLTEELLRPFLGLRCAGILMPQPGPAPTAARVERAFASRITTLARCISIGGEASTMTRGLTRQLACKSRLAATSLVNEPTRKSCQLSNMPSSLARQSVR